MLQNINKIVASYKYELLISLIFALPVFLFKPILTNDIIKYFELYNYFLEGNDFVCFYDFLFQFYIYIFAKLNIDLNILLYIMMFGTIFLKLIIVKKYYTKHKREYDIALIYFIVLLTISFSGAFSGVRFTHALSFFFMGHFLIFYLKRNIGYVFILYSILFHFSFLFPFALMVIFLLFKNKKAIIGYCLIFSVIVFLLINVFKSSDVFINVYLKDKIIYYTSQNKLNWESIYFGYLNQKIYWIIILSVIISLFYFILYYYEMVMKNEFLLFSICLLILTVFYFEVFVRYIEFLKFYLILFLFRIKLRKIELVLNLLPIFLIQILHLWVHRVNFL